MCLYFLSLYFRFYSFALISFRFLPVSIWLWNISHFFPLHLCHNRLAMRACVCVCVFGTYCLYVLFETNTVYVRACTLHLKMCVSTQTRNQLISALCKIVCIRFIVASAVSTCERVYTCVCVCADFKRFDCDSFLF